MAGNKYSKYILTDVNRDYLATLQAPKSIEEKRKSGNYMESTYMVHLNNTILEGGFDTDCHWVTGIKGNGGVTVSP